VTDSLHGLQSTIVLVLCIPSAANCQKRRFPTIVEHSNKPGHKRNQNAVAGVGGLNFPVAYKSVITKA